MEVDTVISINPFVRNAYFDKCVELAKLAIDASSRSSWCYESFSEAYNRLEDFIEHHGIDTNDLTRYCSVLGIDWPFPNIRMAV